MGLAIVLKIFTLLDTDIRMIYDKWWFNARFDMYS